MNASFRKKLQYRFDNTMSKGPVALIAWLGIISLVVIIIAAIIVSLFGIQHEDSNVSFIEAFWLSLMRTLDPGTMGGDTGWPFRIIMLLVTMAGIFIVSTLIGVLSSGIEGKLDELRKGKSEVLEENFTLILGWSSKLYTIISELVLANENQKNPRIAILSVKDKVEMEDDIQNNISELKNTKVICRSGDPTNINDLKIVNPAKSKSIIILGKDDNESDFEIIKTILALTNFDRQERKIPYHIIAEMQNAENLEVAKMIAKDEAEFILTDDIIARLMVQTSRQCGLSIVYTELMDYGGDEIYYTKEKSLTGKTYRDALFAYETSSVMGIKQQGKSMLNPPMNTILNEGDEIIAISEDDDTLVVSSKTNFETNEAAINKIAPVVERKKERILLIGWNKRVIRVVKELTNYISKDSEIAIVANLPKPEELTKQEAALSELTNLSYIQTDTASRKSLENLNVFSYDYILVFSYEMDDVQKSDSVTIITLLHLRDMSDKTNKDINIVSEMLDLKNRELATVTDADDFIVSDKMLSLLITQVSENKDLMRVFEDILDESGSEIYMKPVTDYISVGHEINYYTLLQSAADKGHTAIGYRISKDKNNSDLSYGVVINPPKTIQLNLDADDKLIVLAED